MGQPVDVVSPAFAKAFDFVPRIKLVENLLGYGVRGLYSGVRPFLGQVFNKHINAPVGCFRALLTALSMSASSFADGFRHIRPTVRGKHFSYSNILSYKKFNAFTHNPFFFTSRNPTYAYCRQEIMHNKRSPPSLNVTRA